MSMMWRALTARKRGRFQGELPRFEAHAEAVSSDRLAAFGRLFALGEPTELPISFPHLLAAPLHMDIATRPEFPLPALGLVHLSNHIVQHRPIATDTPLDLHVWVEGHRMTSLGVEFDLHTEASVAGHCHWTERSTVLSRAVSGDGPKPEAPKPPPVPEFEDETWELPANWGRAYARVSGDWNPIHLYAWTAKVFGFSRPIAHGMALLARVGASLPRPGDGPITLSTRFLKPVYLPASIQCRMAPAHAGHTFVLRGNRPHAFGWYGPGVDDPHRPED